jgi:D-xylose transport system substrate-binding protein
MKIVNKKAVLSAAALVVMAVTLTACSNSSSASGSGSGSSGKVDLSTSTAKIGLLLPDNVTARYAAQDRPLFTAEIKKLCPHCDVLYENAAASASTQQQQAQSMLTQGVKVMVLDAEDGEAAATIVTQAKQKNVPVISYDRLVDSPDLAAYISFDNEKVGALQATALVARLKELGVPSNAGILEVNGSPTDNNATQFKKGAQGVLNKTSYKILGEYDTPDWLPAKAQAWAQGQISKVGASNIKGVYAANDDTGGAVITALQGAGLKTVPPVTGQDATVAGIQRILTGTQYMTVYKAPKPEAETAAKYAIKLLQGKKLGLTTKAKTAKGYSVPAKLFNPVAVTASNVEKVIINSGDYTASQICTSQYQAACTKYGVK